MECSLGFPNLIKVNRASIKMKWKLDDLVPFLNRVNSTPGQYTRFSTMARLFKNEQGSDYDKISCRETGDGTMFDILDLEPGTIYRFQFELLDKETNSLLGLSDAKNVVTCLDELKVRNIGPHTTHVELQWNQAKHRTQASSFDVSSSAVWYVIESATGLKGKFERMKVTKETTLRFSIEQIFPAITKSFGGLEVLRFRIGVALGFRGSQVWPPMSKFAKSTKNLGLFVTPPKPPLLVDGNDHQLTFQWRPETVLNARKLSEHFKFTVQLEYVIDAGDGSESEKAWKIQNDNNGLFPKFYGKLATLPDSFHEKAHSQFTQIHSRIFTIENLTASTWYWFRTRTCLNSLASVACSEPVPFSTAPSLPTKPGHCDFDHTIYRDTVQRRLHWYLKLSWIHAHGCGAPIEYYIVERYHPVLKHWDLVYRDSPCACVLSALLPYSRRVKTSWKFRIRAGNCIGQGPSIELDVKLDTDEVQEIAIGNEHVIHQLNHCLDKTKTDDLVHLIQRRKQRTDRFIADFHPIGTDVHQSKLRNLAPLLEQRDDEFISRGLAPFHHRFPKPPRGSKSPKALSPREMNHLQQYSQDLQTCDVFWTYPPQHKKGLHNNNNNKNEDDPFPSCLDPDDESEQERKNAAIRVQAQYRAFQGKRMADRLRAERVEINLAATKMQAMFRQAKARREYLELKSITNQFVVVDLSTVHEENMELDRDGNLEMEFQLNKINLEDDPFLYEHMTSAAMVVQSQVRGAIVRKRYEQQKQTRRAATIVQKNYRMFRDRVQFERRRRIAIQSITKIGVMGCGEETARGVYEIAQFEGEIPTYMCLNQVDDTTFLLKRTEQNKMLVWSILKISPDGNVQMLYANQKDGASLKPPRRNWQVVSGKQPPPTLHWREGTSRIEILLHNQTAVVVTDGGVQQAHGRYIANGTASNVPKFRLDVGTNSYFIQRVEYNGQKMWIHAGLINGETNEAYYVNTVHGESNYPPDDGWQIAQNGVPPVPLFVYQQRI